MFSRSVYAVSVLVLEVINVKKEYVQFDGKQLLQYGIKIRNLLLCSFFFSSLIVNIVIQARNATIAKILQIRDFVCLFKILN